MNISSFIFTYLKNKLPDINWTIGSTIRELIATPVVALAESATTALNEQVNAMSIANMETNPELYKEEIEDIFNALSLNTNNSTESSGVVTLMTTISQPSAVLKNTTFYIGDQSVIVTMDTFPMLNVDGSSGSTQLREEGYKAYSFDVPVSSVGINTYLPIYTKLTWDEAPDDIYDITVTSAISGGRLNMTVDEKLQKIKDYISPEVLSLSDGIAKTLRKHLPDIVADAKYAADPVDKSTTYANTINNDGVNKSYLYVKTLKAPGYEYIDVEGTLTADGLYTIDTKIIGIINLVNIYKNGKKVSMHQVQVINNKLYCTVEFTGSNSELFTLKVYRIAYADIIQDFLDGYTAGSPFKIEIKAPATFNLTLDFKYTGQELNTQDYIAICSAIQSTSLDTIITDIKLNSILEELGASLNGTCAYTLSTYTGCTYKQQYSTALYYSVDATSYAIYLGVTNINAKYI